MDEPKQPVETEGRKKRDLFLPVSILAAALLVSGALVWSGVQSRTANNQANLAAQAGGTQGSPNNMAPISSSDHILGNVDAPVKIVEYSDLECPYCKEFQATLHQVVQTYGDKVVWVFRDAPLVQLHPKAEHEAEASECAATLGGNDAFWKYIDEVFSVTPSNNGLDPAELPKIAGDIGLDVAKFNQCLSSGKEQATVAADLQDAMNAGIAGTPYAIVIAPSGHKYVIPGALPFEPTVAGQPSVKQIIDTALADK